MLSNKGTAFPIAGAAVLAVGLSYFMASHGAGAIHNVIAPPALAQETDQPRSRWAASATGRVEPVSGELSLSSEASGRIVEVLGSSNDQVKAGDLLVRLDDSEIYAKIAAARAEVSVRIRERKEEQATGLGVDRRKSEDALASAQRALFDAREAFDAARREAIGNAQPTTSDDIEQKRDAVTEAEADVRKKQKELLDIMAKPDIPEYQRLEASLATARAELTSYENALERTRVRAPQDGTILDMIANVGEMTTPSPANPMVLFGDISSLKLRAEVEERDAAKVKVGQRVVVKSDAYPDQTFTGKVISISQSLGSPRIASRGPRRPNVVEVVEVMVTLDGNPPLLTGMRVDTFFEHPEAKSASKTDGTTTN